MTIGRLKARAVFGINGKVPGGLKLHPDRKHMMYPLGEKIVIYNYETKVHEFISGHSKTVSCLDISKNGVFFASGQRTHMGFRAILIVWDFAERKEIARHDLHKVRVQSICFSAQDRYVISIGGLDDDTVIVFDMEAHTPICQAVASKAIFGHALKVTCLNKNPGLFIVSGDNHLRMWSVERARKKLNVTDIVLGKYKRRFLGVHIDDNDEFAYLATMSGDIVRICLNCCDVLNVTKPGYNAYLMGAYGLYNPRKPWGKDCQLYPSGVRDVRIIDQGILLVGTGDGTLELVEERKETSDLTYRNYPGPTWPRLRTLKKIKVNGAVTSMVSMDNRSFLIGTDKNEIYQLYLDSFGLKLMFTSHKSTVHCIAFPRNISSVFATAGYETIRIWSVGRLQELLRIIVHNFHCSSFQFAHDGTSIVSAWNDGVIRAFTPLTGRLIYFIPNAHNKGCSALAISSNGRLLVSGGIEGQVRVWKIEPHCQSLLAVLKDHSGPISSIDFNHLDTEVISASVDGSCVIWDVARLRRKQVFTANTQFLCGRYFPGSIQVLTCGSDGSVNYWVVYNGSLIRELEASKKSAVNCIASSNTGDYFVTVGSDQTVKLWDHKRGMVLVMSEDHCESVICCAYSPCGTFFVTGSADGALIVWDVPKRYWEGPPAKAETAKAPSKKKFDQIESKVDTGSARPPPKKENIEDLLASTKSGDICCVECPAVENQKKINVNELCNFVPKTKKC